MNMNPAKSNNDDGRNDKEFAPKQPVADRTDSGGDLPPTLKIVPTIYPTSPPPEESLEQFWRLGEAFQDLSIQVRMPERPLAILENLGPSPFERGEFPLIGFLATTYDKVSRYACERGTGKPGLVE